MRPSLQYEHDIASEISRYVPAERPTVSVDYADVKVRHQEADHWVEVKMNQGDNLMNPRFCYKHGRWGVPYELVSPATQTLIDHLNENDQAKEWIEDLRKFLATLRFTGDASNLSIYSAGRDRKADGNSVSVRQMKEFLRARDNKNICVVPHADVGKLVAEHYLFGKGAPAHYISCGDDFYRLSVDDPLGLVDVPIFSGFNRLAFRVGDRSRRHEIMPEVKLYDIKSSSFSVQPESSKYNPFKSLL